MASSMLTAEATASASTEADEASNTTKHSCANDPDFAIICDFLQKFSTDLGLNLPNFNQLLDWLSKTDEVSPHLREMQIKLLRKTRKTVHEKSWESALSKFCFTYSAQDAWEIERFGYKNSSVKVKLRILRELLESQFERNSKFRAKTLALSADSLRSQPIGRDRLGHAYWVTQDKDCNIRIYQEHLDEEIWQVVATNREEFVNLIKRLRGSEVVLPSAEIGTVDEDTSSSISSRTCSESVLNAPEDKGDLQDDKQKVPKLSIKLLQERNSNDGNTKDVGKGEEELAAEEDAKTLKKSPKSLEATESDEEEFEEIEEEYESDEDDDDEDIDEDDDDDDISNNDKKDLENTNSELKLQKNTKPLDDTKKVKPLLITQNKVVNITNSATNATGGYSGKKRSLDQVESNSLNCYENPKISSLKKSRPSLIDSKHSKKQSKYDKDDGEEDNEVTVDENDDIEEEIDEEDIDSVAAEEDENEEKEYEDFDDDDEDEVGEEITEPVLSVKGEGSGKECDVGNSWFYIEYDINNCGPDNNVGTAIEDEIFYVRGEGYGKECLVGNNKSEKNTSKITIQKSVDTKEIHPSTSAKLEVNSNLLEQPECLKTIPIIKDCETKTNAENIDHKTEIISENIDSVKEIKIDNQVNAKTEKTQTNGGNNHKELQKEKLTEINKVKSNSTDSQLPISSNTAQKNLADENKLDSTSKEDKNVSQAVACSSTKQLHASKMSVLESLKKELRESKQKSMEKSSSMTDASNKTKFSSPVSLNRKRRLDDLTAQQTTNIRHSNSESEIDINSENLDDQPNEHELDNDDLDVGGKRLKIRSKQTNSELRKKIEAQKVAANEENTSSSSGEEESRRRRKLISPKKHDDNKPMIINLEESCHKVNLLKNNNCGEKKDDLQSKGDHLTKKLDCSNSSIISARIPTLIATVKNKPTLAEIIEKKLKKTPELIENELVSASADEKRDAASATKCIFAPPVPSKSPITKPLKKNLLSQIRQKESGEDAVPRKRTNSEDLISPELSVVKALEGNEYLTDKKQAKLLDTQKNTVERQRKRRSSDKTPQHENPEEPGAKKDVMCAELEKDLIIKVETSVDKKETTVQEETITVTLSPVPGRRSGRRGVFITSSCVEIAEPKKSRGCSKKKVMGICNEEDKIDTKVGTKECTQSKDSLKNKDMSEDKTGPKLKVEEREDTKSKEESDIKELSIPQTPIPKAQSPNKSPVKGFRKQRDVDATNIIEVIDNETPVRQSRRIAQQKIREEAERRKLEEIALRTMKQELKKKKKAEKEADPTMDPPSEPSSESEESDVETKRKAQKKKCPGKNGSWSSGSEEQEEPDEEDEEPPHYEIDPGSPLFKSDHEFSPESDIEDESQVVPMKRARTVRKEDAPDGEKDEEEACQKCNKSDHPEWILLCDNCDKGYHCSCLSPVLFYIPEGDWYCPPCQQEQLIKALESQLKEFDNLVEHKKNEEEKEKLKLAEEEKVRQAEETRKLKKNKKQKKKNKRNNDDSSNAEGSHSSHKDEDGESSSSSDESLNKNLRKSLTKNKNSNRSKNDKRNHRDRRQNITRNARSRAQKRESDSDSGTPHKSKSASRSNSSSSSSSSYSESDNEPIYKLRKRRQINVSYRLNEYDDLINSALKKEMDEAAGAGNLGRGKDITTIIEADKEEQARQKQLEESEPSIEEISKKSENTKEEEENEDKKLEAKCEKKQETIEEDSDDEPIHQKFKIKPSLKKKSRKLTTLDISSDDDNASDEDFKGSSLEDEDEEDTSISASNSDSSLEIYKRKGKSKKKRRKAARRAFRNRRKDRKFVVDESDDEDVQRPKSKKKRKDDSDYTESEADYDDLSELSENIDSADLCNDTTTDESDGGWRPNKRKKAKKSTTSFVQKSPKPKKPEPKKNKKVEYSDDDISETEEEDDENDTVGGGKGMGGKQPRSQPLKNSTTSTKVKTKGKGKEGISSKTKKNKKSSEDEESSENSADSTRRTRGRRYAYLEDFDDDSSDGGIKPGVQRPDTPPEEREKFIKRQEEIKRMLAEKNAEGAKLAATPRLTPIKTDSEKDKRSPVKASGDSLSTVPLSVIRQAKVLDIDYLQRRGESLDDLSNDVGDVDDDFDDADLPDDLPEDMDEDTIARMVEEEEEFGEAAARELPAPDEVLRAVPNVKPKTLKDGDKPSVTSNVTPFPLHAPQIPVTLPPSGLQEPVRKRLPMPTMHPPLLRHQFLLHDAMASAHLIQRHSGPPQSHLLQNALSAPLTQPLGRNYPPSAHSPSHHSLINRITQSAPMPPTIPNVISTTRPPLSNSTQSADTIDHLGKDKSTNARPEAEMKPRGRRKKITPLRDPLQKQQAAAAVTAATATNSVMAAANANTKESINTSVSSSVIKIGQSVKGHMQASVITSMPPTTQPMSSRPTVTMPPVSGIYTRSDGPRFYDPLGNRHVIQRQRGPPLMPPSLLPPHPPMRSSYGPPPPLKGSSSVTANSSISSAAGSIRTPMHHVPPYVGMPPNPRHSAQHLNLYSRPSIYGNPNFGPRVNLRPPNIHTSEYSTGSRAYSPYGFYPPPPPLTAPRGQGPPSAQMPQIQPSITSPPTSVIVSAAVAAKTTSVTVPSGANSKSGTVTQVLPIKVGASNSPMQSRVPQISKVVAEPRKKLTTLQAYTTTSAAKKSLLAPPAESSGSQSTPGTQTEVAEESSTPGVTNNSPPTDQNRVEGHASEFSGLVSYFSSQHDDYNT